MKKRTLSLTFTFCAAAALLAGCVGPAPSFTYTPLPKPSFTPAPRVEPAPIEVASNPTLPAPSPEPTRESQALPEAEFAQPAGCLSAAEQAGLSPEQMLAYADALLGFSRPLSERRLSRVWNAAKGMNMALEAGVLALDVNDIRDAWRLQPALNALHVAGFAAFLRDDEHDGTHILAISLNQAPPTAWESYAAGYWSEGAPAGDRTILPGLRLTPCDWMVASGQAPDRAAGVMEAADWSQPDLAAAGAAYLAGTTEAAFEVAFEIDWLENGKTESPVTMCGPLAWSICADGRLFPPGYGGWMEGPKSFWLPSPEKNGRPWSLFPPDTYIIQKIDQPLGSFDFSTYPLQPADIVYTYSGGDGFDHILVVTDVDETGRVYAVSNVIRYKPEKLFTIEHVLLYDPNDPQAGFFHNEWCNDLANGRTGHKGFEVLRWNWRAKDITGQAASDTVRAGDTLPLIAARWHTLPEAILQANGLEQGAQLLVGQELVIPAMP